MSDKKSNKKWCYDCKNYYTSTFCGYNASYCRVHGSLDMDQKERHPDITANTCEDYDFKGTHWYDKQGVIKCVNYVSDLILDQLLMRQTDMEQELFWLVAVIGFQQKDNLNFALDVVHLVLM